MNDDPQDILDLKAACEAAAERYRQAYSNRMDAWEAAKSDAVAWLQHEVRDLDVQIAKLEAARWLVLRKVREAQDSVQQPLVSSEERTLEREWRSLESELRYARQLQSIRRKTGP